MTQQHDTLTLEVVMGHLERIETAMYKVVDALEQMSQRLDLARREAAEQHASQSRALGMHHDQTNFYQVQFVSAFNLLGGKINALAEIATRRGLQMVEPERLIAQPPLYEPLPEIEAHQERIAGQRTVESPRRPPR